MPLDLKRTRKLLQHFDLKTLFIEELGWDRCDSRPLEVLVEGRTFTLTPISEKKGMVAFQCGSHTGAKIPDYAVRRKIEKQTAKSVHEHLIIYTDAENTTQIWQWVKRELGKPTVCREHTYYKNQPGDALVQKLQLLTFDLVEEEKGLTIVDVAGRTRKAFDVDRVTKRFYDRFKQEHTAFRKFIHGIQQQGDLDWYASVMLNRLMFIYFIQKKGFMDGDHNYLSNRLKNSKRKDRFYHDFLTLLFFDGFAKEEKDRSAEIKNLLGRIPYLNGGIFLPHQLEQIYGKQIQITDAAFEQLFMFFEQYQWHLDERPLQADNQINPDVLGLIFEKYVNQKQMGAYYTKEDITEYISKNTVIPFLFDQARKKCKIAFEGEQAVWSLLMEDPDRYIYPAVKKGVDLPLPDEIAAGQTDVSKRTEWNKPAQEEHALPTEIWREVVTRRKRYEEVRGKLTAGEIRSINDFITYNLDIRQFAQDVIENCEGPELLRAFWHAIEKVTVLDPTCGSGAFLFAALNILEPLYEACLIRMQAFIDDLNRSDQKHRPEKFSDFRKVLERVEQHPNHRYFVFKSIIINNLYGVDIMEEATEICKLRLFLKLMAQVEHVKDIEPLPDIDFNIRAGNTLVGYATYEEVEKAVKGDGQQPKLNLYNDMERIDEKAQYAGRAFQLFREMQTDHGMTAKKYTDAKHALRNRLKELEAELNRYLAEEYNINPSPARHSREGGNPSPYEKWLRSHQPFHWFIEFYAIIKSGGFDVIIGNPPYVEYSKVKKEYTLRGYETEKCGNLYAYVLELILKISRLKARNGMIVQLPIVCTDRMIPLQNILSNNSHYLWFSSFDDRPARLFDGLEHIRATIAVNEVGNVMPKVLTTKYNRWQSGARDSLFENIAFGDLTDWNYTGAFPKLGDIYGIKIVRKILKFNQLAMTLSGSEKIYFHNAPQYWIRSMTFAPFFWNERDGEQLSTQVKVLRLSNHLDASVVVAALNSSLFYWWFIVLSDCRHLNMREIENFPIGLDQITEEMKQKLSVLTDHLMEDLKGHANRKECCYKTTGKVAYDEFYPKFSKPIIDKIDQVLAKHYGFTDEELDFIINYDIKYRMGKHAE